MERTGLVESEARGAEARRSLGSRHLFKKPGDLTAAGGVLEKQGGRVAAVFSFQCSVLGESHEHGAERRNSTLMIGERRADHTDIWSFFL